MTRLLLIQIFLIACYFAGIKPSLANSENGPQIKSLHFIENIGQITDQYYTPRTDIDFKLKAADGLNIFIGKGNIHYQWAKSTAPDKSNPFLILQNNEAQGSSEVEMYRMDVQLIGTNPNAYLLKDKKQDFFERYYLSSILKEDGKAYSYNRITYKNIYSNIDWVFYFNEQGLLEHDFIIHPGGKVSDIKIQYNGASTLQVNKNGELIAKTQMGTVKENAPITFQQKDGKAIESAFILNDNMLSFSTKEYEGTLIIDPTLEWATYFGGLDYDDMTGVKVGKDNFVYSSGSTNSTNNIATTGAFQTNFGGGYGSEGADAFITKFDVSGNLIWATFYGGDKIEKGMSIDLDTAGNIYVAGRTQSSDGIATTGIHQEVKAGGASSYDAFIVKFDTSGQRIWGTYFGGTGHEGSESIIISCDNADNVYLAGNTQSANGIATTGAFQEIRLGGHEGFLAKFNTDGILDWSTYFGGSTAGGYDDFINAICTDTLGDIYITGNTNDASGIATAGAYQTVFGGASGLTADVFLAKFNSSGQRLWATYLGGTENDQAYSIMCDSTGSVYIGGTTGSTSGIASTGSFQDTFGGALDGFLAKFSPTGNLDWATYLGGNGTDVISGLHYSRFNNQGYMTGSTSSTNNISISNVLSTTLTGTQNAFIGAFDEDGIIQWNGYFGGMDGASANSISGNENGDLFVAGITSSAVGISTNNAHQTAFGGYADGLLLHIKDCEIPVISNEIFGDLTVCEGNTYTYKINSVQEASAYHWTIPSGWTGSSQTDSIELTAGSASGILEIAVSNFCGTSDTISLSITVNSTPEPVVNRNGNVLETTQLFQSYQWNINDEPIDGATNPTYIIMENGQYSVTVTNQEDCQAISEEVSVNDFTGIENRLVEAGIEFYPNPVVDGITIKTRIPIQIDIIEITGRKLAQQTIGVGTTWLNLVNYANGLYLLNVHNSNSQFLGSFKISKKGK